MAAGHPSPLWRGSSAGLSQMPRNAVPSLLLPPSPDEQLHCLQNNAAVTATHLLNPGSTRDGGEGRGLLPGLTAEFDCWDPRSRTELTAAGHPWDALHVLCCTFDNTHTIHLKNIVTKCKLG